MCAKLRAQKKGKEKDERPGGGKKGERFELKHDREAISPTSTADGLKSRPHQLETSNKRWGSFLKNKAIPGDRTGRGSMWKGEGKDDRKERTEGTKG